jgi:HrpA-like RNA helicase
LRNTSIGTTVISTFRFDYIDPPEEKMVMEAVKQLYILGALDR